MRVHRPSSECFLTMWCQLTSTMLDGLVSPVVWQDQPNSVHVFCVFSGHCRGAWEQQGVVCNLQPHCWMLLNPTHWSFICALYVAKASHVISTLVSFELTCLPGTATVQHSLPLYTPPTHSSCLLSYNLHLKWIRIERKEHAASPVTG